MLVHAGDAVVEGHGVDDDGAGHAARLWQVAHAEQPGDFRADARSQIGHRVQFPGDVFDSLFQRMRGLVHGPLRHGCQANEVGEIVNRAVQPAGIREPARRLLAVAFREDAIGKPGFPQGGGQVVGLADGFGIAQGDDGLHGAGIDGRGQAEAFLGIALRRISREVFRFHDDGRMAGGGDQDVGLLSGVPGDDLRVLGAHLGAGQPVLKQGAQGGVGVRLGLVWHWLLAVWFLRHGFFLLWVRRWMLPYL